jgi:nucleolar pre-ribosomal-associated protein 2
MTFSHLESIGRCLLKIHKRSSRRSREGLNADDASRDRENFGLLQQLAVLTLRYVIGIPPLTDSG